MKSTQEKRYGSSIRRRGVRLFLFFEATSFIVASLIHSGVLITGYEHQKARIAEGVIAAVLAAGLVLSWLMPARTRAFGLIVQGFALLGTFVGLFTIAVGIGPRTVPDLIYHVAIIIVLGWGLTITARARSGNDIDHDEHTK